MGLTGVNWGLAGVGAKGTGLLWDAAALNQSFKPCTVTQFQPRPTVHVHQHTSTPAHLPDTTANRYLVPHPVHTYRPYSPYVRP